MSSKSKALKKVRTETNKEGRERGEREEKSFQKAFKKRGLK